MNPNTLAFCDDRYHPAATVRAGLEPLLAMGYSFDWVTDARNWSPDNLLNYRTALLSKSNVMSHADHAPWLTGLDETIFDRFVFNGGGLVVVHSGTASYKDVTPIRQVLGGVFLNHPPACEIQVSVTKDNAITRGVARLFSVHDEHYQMALDDPDAEVFMRTTSIHGTQPAGWLRRHGQGKVCVLTPGHTLEVWQHPEFQKLLLNALNWVR